MQYKEKCVFLNYVALIVAILVSCPESETAIVTGFTTQPSSPSSVGEGQNLTLVWTYALDGTVGLAQFSIIPGTSNGTELAIGRRFGPGVITVKPEYQARFRAQATNTRAELNILAVQRSDQTTYRMNVVPSGTGELAHLVVVTVNYLPNITEISGNQTVIEGRNLTLNCSAVGKPIPDIVWTKLSDNSAVSMPLTEIRRQDAGKYRCTADNGIGSPAFGDIWIDVQFKPENASLSTNLSKLPVVCASMVANFTCTVEASNPAVDTFTLYENGSMISSKTDSGVWIKTVDACGEATYKCQANNSVGTSSSSNISFTVGVKATAAVESNRIVVTEGQDVNLVCIESGFPSPNTLWVNVSNVVMDHGRTLSLYNISRTMAGQYTCSARNSCGNDSQKVDLIVQYPPEVNGSGRNATVAGGAEHKFSCPVDGNPVPNITWYHVSVSYEAHRGKQFKTSKRGCYICVARNIHGAADNITQCLFINSSLPTVAPSTGQSQTMVSSTTVSQNSSQIMVSSTTASQGPSSSSATPPKGLRWIIIIVVVAGVVLLAVLVGVLTWWVHKQRKCRKATKIHNSDLGRHDDQGGHSQVPGAYAQSGPPAANGPDGAAEQEIEVARAIPTYAVVNKSKKSKKQADEKPPEYAVVDKSKKKEEQEAAAIPTYAAVDKSKKKKKSREEVPPVYAEVDKSKKKKKKKIDDKNLYENLDEPKKEKKPGELLYADLGDFQNPSMPAVSVSPQPLPAIKKADPYERTDYADITQFLKGNATLPPNDGNGDTEMKPKRPSKKKEIQGNDKETPI